MDKADYQQFIDLVAKSLFPGSKIDISKKIVGTSFGLHRYSSVSSAVVRVKTKLQKDRKFKDRLECIESNILILKGQT